MVGAVISQAQRNARRNLRDRRWRSMDLLALFALKDRLQSRGITVPAILFRRLAVEHNKMRRDPKYAATVLAQRPLNGRPTPRARQPIGYDRRPS
jgi:hypothetical protein